ncbi:hypothetical protein PL321_16875 [Caloramator sp. mosi_1]|nr:hypothetical protein [Caloramator sp. mosi_1]WDC84012.1 hypothetical protein PL321_16875 [Caloramator sp. mosi_1]
MDKKYLLFIKATTLHGIKINAGPKTGNKSSIPQIKPIVNAFSIPNTKNQLL